MIVGLALILGPLAMAGVTLAIPSDRWRPRLLPVTGAGYLALAMVAIARGGEFTVGGWLNLDPPGRLVMLLLAVLYFLCAVYAVGYLADRGDRPNRIFCACLQALLGTMTLAVWSHHLGLMWVALEASTLLTAPLIYFNKSPLSIEATWKYLLVGSIGIALALLGTFFLAYASFHEGKPSSLLFDDLLREAPALSKPWLHAAFVLLLVGYGTKMGLAPMHTWKPDAYGEAPGLVGALLAGGMTSCAFLALLRIFHICRAAGEGPYAGRLLVFIGLLSMAIAGLFMIGQRDFKRMLAYSSVEHMGILALGLGLGGGATFGALLHLVNNGLNKGALFLAAANIHRAFEAKTTGEVSGAIRRLPLSGSIFLFGFLAITGSPPFAPFVSEFTILNSAFGERRYVAGGLFLLFLFVVFIGMGQTVLTVVQGRPPAAARATAYRDRFLTGAPILAFFGMVLVLGLWIPGPLKHLLSEAIRYLEVKP